MTMLDGLLEDLRRAPTAELGDRVRAMATRLQHDAAWRRDLQAEVAALFLATHATHPLTEDGILADEGIFAGVARRLGTRLAPAPADGVALQDRLRRGDADWLKHVPLDAAEAFARALTSDALVREDPSELAAAMVILATRIAGSGMDPRLTERVPDLQAWSSPFLLLTRVADDHAERIERGAATEADRTRVLEAIDACAEVVASLRARKRQLGTTLLLSSRSLRMAQQLRRLRLLVLCSAPAEAGGLRAAAELGLDLMIAASRRAPIRHFIGEKLELLGYLAVGHAAQKGEQYAAHNRSDIKRFLKKSLLGGLLVGLFASLKVHLTLEGLAPVPQALLYGANYALCFVLIYLAGATLATKQPALTASRLSQALEAGESHEHFAYLVRAIWRTQFLSFVGNIFGAAACALLLAAAFHAVVGTAFVDPAKAAQLGQALHPTASGTIFYAAIAGVFLSVSGFFAGAVDNAVIFHRIGDRIRAGSGVFRRVPARWRPRLADHLDQNLGGLSGNVLLGLLLGSAGAFGVVFGLPVDIRHIAFASSHSALALVYGGPGTPGPAVLVAAVLLIGLVNFLVSFSLTLGVAISARQVEGVAWRPAVASLWRLARARPLQFFLPLSPDPREARLRDP